MRGKPYPFERSTSKITGPISPDFCRSFSVFAVHRLINKNVSESKVQLQLSDDNSLFVTDSSDSVCGAG